MAAGSFVSDEHATSGKAAVVRSGDGRRLLQLADLDTSAGPDLRVRLEPRSGGRVDLGRLRGNRGDQQYVLPAAIDARELRVVVWCRAFSVGFGSALLRPV